MTLEALTAATASMQAAADAYNGKVAEIDDRVNTLIPTVAGVLARTIYLNADTGDDANTGEINAPVRTMAGAAALTVHGGYYRIYLQTDLVLEGVSRPKGAGLLISSDTVGVKRKIRVEGASVAGSNEAPTIVAPPTVNSILLADIDIELGVGAVGTTFRRMFVAGQQTTFDFWNCNFLPLPGADVSLVQSNWLLSISLRVSTYAADMDGLWLFGEAAGTDPATIPRLLVTDLTSL